MREVYSRLWHLLDERGWRSSDLERSMAEAGVAVDQKTLGQLTDPDQPIKLLNLQSAEAICRVLGSTLGDLLVFAPSLQAQFDALPRKKQRRLDALMDRHSEGALDERKVAELTGLVQEVQEIGLTNTLRVVAHRDYLRHAGTNRQHSADEEPIPRGR